MIVPDDWALPLLQALPECPRGTSGTIIYVWDLVEQRVRPCTWEADGACWVMVMNTSTTPQQYMRVDYDEVPESWR